MTIDVLTPRNGELVDFKTYDVDEDNVVQHVKALQEANKAVDSYDFLDEDELNALQNLINTSASNRFVPLDRTREELEVLLASIPVLLAPYRKKCTRKAQSRSLSRICLPLNWIWQSP